MLTVSFNSSNLRHTVTGDAIAIIRYFIDEACYSDLIEIISVDIHNNDSPKDD